MIINIRGTSGSGKSTLIRRVMDHYEKGVPIFIPGRKRPIAYTLRHCYGGKDLALIGHYETACGGCDTIADVKDAFAWVEYMDMEGYDVLFEGLLIAADVNRTKALHDAGLEVHVIALGTSLELCLESVNARRWAKDPTKPPVNPHNTKSKHRGVELSLIRMRAAKMNVYEVNREDAFEVLIGLLKICPCRLCDGTGWFYGDEDLGPCPCPYGSKHGDPATHCLLL